MTISESITNWEKQMQRNNDSAKRLGSQGMFELVSSCHADNRLIACFIKDLKEIQLWQQQNKGPG